MGKGDYEPRNYRGGVEVVQTVSSIERSCPHEARERREQAKLGWLMGLEPTTLGTTIRCSTN